MRVSTDASCHTHEIKIRKVAAVRNQMTTQDDAKGWKLQSTNGSLVSTFLHQTEELLRGAVVTVLLIQLLHCGQQLIDDGLQLRTAYCL